MGLRTALRDLSERWAAEQRALTNETIWRDVPEAWRPSTSTGRRVTIEDALKVPAVNRAFSLMSGDISGLPIDTFRRDSGQRLPVQTPDWIETPDPANPNYRRPQFVSHLVVSAMWDGNIFIRCYPDRYRVQWVRVLDPSKVTIETDAEGVDTYRVGTVRLSSAEVVHVPLVALAGFSRGQGPVHHLRETIATALAAEEYGGRFFANGAVMSGMVEVPAGAQVDPDQLRKQMERKHAGTANSHALGVLTGGATFRPLTVDAEKSQLTELQKFVVEQVGRVYGIPPYLLGSQEPGAVAYASTSNARIDYVQHAVQPLVARIEEALSALLPDGVSLRFNLNALLRGDQQARYTAYNTMLQAGVITKDEVRAWEDWGPADDAVGVETEHGGFLESPNNTAPSTDPTAVDTTPGVTP